MSSEGWARRWTTMRPKRPRPQPQVRPGRCCTRVATRMAHAPASSRGVGQHDARTLRTFLPKPVLAPSYSTRSRAAQAHTSPGTQARGVDCAPREPKRPLDQPTTQRPSTGFHELVLEVVRNYRGKLRPSPIRGKGCRMRTMSSRKRVNGTSVPRTRRSGAGTNMRRPVRSTSSPYVDCRRQHRW